MPTIAVNSIEIPSKFIELCRAWHGGQDDLLYAVASTGGLTLGTRRPVDCDTDEEWYVYLWEDLETDVRYAVRAASRGKKDIDFDKLVRFVEFCEATIRRLRHDYKSILGDE